MDFLLKDSWINEALSHSYRTRTAAVENTIGAMRSITSEPHWSEQSETPRVLCLMNSSGTGKTCTVIDAALICEFLHLHVMLPSFVGIVDVVSRCPSFFVHPKSDEYLARLDVVNGFKALYKAQLAHLFASCRDAIQREPFAASTRRVYPRPVVPPVASDDIVEIAWFSLLDSIPETERVVLHVDDCHSIFGWRGNFPQSHDLLPGDPEDRFGMSDAPRLALRSFIESLVPYISRSRKIVWVFTGLHPNMRVFLSVPEKLVCVDLSMYLQDFDVEAVYSVFSRSTELVLTPFERLDVRSRKFFERLVGPPRVTEVFLRVLHGLRIRNIDDMIAREDEIVEHVAESLYRMTPGFSQASFEALKFCCIAPLLQSVDLSVNLRLSYWSNLVASGLLRVDLARRTNPEYDVEPITSTEMDGLCYSVVPAYPVLQSILWSMTETSSSTKHSTNGGTSDEMRMALVQKYEPDSVREFVRNMIDGVDSSISHKRGKISLLSSVLPSMYLGGDDFLACVKDTVGDRVEISNAVAQHGLTGLSCLFPSVLQHVADPLFTHETVELLRSLAVMYRVRNGIRNPWEVSLGAGGSDLVWYLRQWGTVERDVSAIKAFLASFDKSALECLTFEALAGCDVALGSRLSVLAVVSSVEQKSWYDEQQNKDRGLSKRKAPSMEDVINELEGLSAISRKALDAFKELCAENASGWCKYDVSNLYAMSHSDLENLGVSSSDAKQLLIRVDSIFDRFGSS